MILLCGVNFKFSIIRITLSSASSYTLLSGNNEPFNNVPHSMQKYLLAVFSLPQFGHVTILSITYLPISFFYTNS